MRRMVAMNRLSEMTEGDYRIEWEHTYDTRIAILRGDNLPPTPAQHAIALAEADEHEKKLRKIFKNL